MAKEETPLFDFQDPGQFRRVAGYLTNLHNKAVEALNRGDPKPHVYRVEVSRVREDAPMSAEQLGYLWAVVYPYAAKGLRETWGDDGVDSVAAHEFFKREFLRRVIVNRTDRAVKGPDGRMVGSGEIVGEWVPHLRDLSSYDRVGYIDAVILYCAEWLGVEVPPPRKDWREPKPPDQLPPRAVSEIRRLPPGKVRGPTAEDGECEAEQDRRAERLAGTPERFE